MYIHGFGANQHYSELIMGLTSIQKFCVDLKRCEGSGLSYRWLYLLVLRKLWRYQQLPLHSPAAIVGQRHYPQSTKQPGNDEQIWVAFLSFWSTSISSLLVNKGITSGPRSLHTTTFGLLVLRWDEIEVRRVGAFDIAWDLPRRRHTNNYTIRGKKQNKRPVGKKSFASRLPEQYLGDTWGRFARANYFFWHLLDQRCIVDAFFSTNFAYSIEHKMTKYIVVSGGVVSGIGKGVIGTRIMFDMDLTRPTICFQKLLRRVYYSRLLA